MNKKESLSEHVELVQTSKRLGRSPKAEVKVNKMTFKIGQPKKSNDSDMHRYCNTP